MEKKAQKEIEVTPEMIEAGCDKVFEAIRFLDGEHLDQSEIDALVRDIFSIIPKVRFGEFA